MAAGCPDHDARDDEHRRPRDDPARQRPARPLQLQPRVAIGDVSARTAPDREHQGAETDDRFYRWRDFELLDRPLVLLIGGGTGVGKSTVATQLAYRLGITRVSSTDLIRQVLRSAVPEAIAPELSRSSFELDHGHLRNGAKRHSEFERQAQQVMVGVLATIERAVAEGMPLIIEGIHLLPELVDVDAVPDSLIVHVVLNVEDEADHCNRFTVRARDSERPAGRYQASLQRIRDLQDHVVATARSTGTPVLANRHLQTTVRNVLELISAAVDDVLPPREAAPGHG